MKTKFILRLFVFFNAFFGLTIYANAQGNCDSILKAYYNTVPGQKKLDYELSFCRGARSAIKQDYLSLCVIGHPKDIAPCTYFAYERYGVTLCIVEDTNRMEEIMAENAGHNFIMRERIKQQMPGKVDSVGVEDPNYFSISNNLNTQIEKDLIVTEKPAAVVSKKEKKKKKRRKKKSDEIEIVEMPASTYIVSLDNGKYSYLSNTKITDLKSGKSYIFSDLYKGIEVVPFSSGENQKLGMQLDITNYDKTKVCKGMQPKRMFWGLEIPVKQAGK